MCINSEGVCFFCNRDYHEKFTKGMKCPSDDCPSKTDLVATLSYADKEPQYFCVYFNGDDYQAVFPETLSQWGCNFSDHESCKKYLEFMADGIELWIELRDYPFDSNGNLERDFYAFPVGTSKAEIWEFFVKTYEASIARDFLPHTGCSVEINQNELLAA